MRTDEITKYIKVLKKELLGIPCDEDNDIVVYYPKAGKYRYVIQNVSRNILMSFTLNAKTNRIRLVNVEKYLVAHPSVRISPNCELCLTGRTMQDYATVFPDLNKKIVDQIYGVIYAWAIIIYEREMKRVQDITTLISHIIDAFITGTMKPFVYTINKNQRNIQFIYGKMTANYVLTFTGSDTWPTTITGIKKTKVNSPLTQELDTLMIFISLIFNAYVTNECIRISDFIEQVSPSNKANTCG